MKGLILKFVNLLGSVKINRGLKYRLHYDNKHVIPIRSKRELCDSVCLPLQKANIHAYYFNAINT